MQIKNDDTIILRREKSIRRKFNIHLAFMVSDDRVPCNLGYYSLNCDDEEGEVIIKQFLSKEEYDQLEARIEKDCQNYLKPKKTIIKQNITLPKKQSGYIYFLQSKRDNFIKIGKAKNISERLEQFSPKLPFDTEIIHTIASTDYCACEKQWHEHFVKKRIRGEWFELTEKDITYIKSK